MLRFDWTFAFPKVAPPVTVMPSGLNRPLSVFAPANSTAPVTVLAGPGPGVGGRSELTEPTNPPVSPIPILLLVLELVKFKLCGSPVNNTEKSVTPSGMLFAQQSCARACRLVEPAAATTMTVARQNERDSNLADRVMRCPPLSPLGASRPGRFLPMWLITYQPMRDTIDPVAGTLTPLGI